MENHFPKSTHLRAHTHTYADLLQDLITCMSLCVIRQTWDSLDLSLSCPVLDSTNHNAMITQLV